MSMVIDRPDKAEQPFCASVQLGAPRAKLGLRNSKSAANHVEPKA